MIRVCMLVGIFLLATHAAAHPQDGPHAEFRFAIEDTRVTQSINLNLAFIDEILPVSRESLGAVAEPEAERLRADLTAWLTENVIVEIDGKRISPRFESIAMNTEPEPGMIALYPRVGARGLIRVLSKLTYPSEAPPERVSFHWPAYPNEILIEEAEPKPMFLEAQLRAEGAMGIVRFSEAEPVVEWARGGTRIQFDEVPPVPEAAMTGSIALSTIALGSAGFVLVLISFIKMTSRAAPLTGFAALGFGLAAWLTPGIGPGITLGSSEEPPFTEQSAEQVARALHANIYNAFEYTSEDDIYDALELSVSGPLLDTLYNQVYSSLIQAEQDGMVGVVTGLDQLEVQIDPLREDLSFAVTIAWQVDGTVYHWGHTHTRTHAYRANYVIQPTESGWRITEQEMLDQQRIDDGLGNTARPIGEL